MRPPSTEIFTFHCLAGKYSAMAHQHLRVIIAWLLVLLACHPTPITCYNASTVSEVKSRLETIHKWRTAGKSLTYGLGLPPHPQPLTSDDTSISPQCEQDLTAMFQNLQVLDAFGKPGAGLFEGDSLWPGNYDECKSLEGYKYCLTDLKLDGNKIGIKGVVIPVRWGICPPASCSEEELMGTIQSFLALLQEKYVELRAVSAVGMTCPASPPIPYSAGVICTIVLLSLLGLLMVLGSLYDECLKFKAKRRHPFSSWLYFSVVNDEEIEGSAFDNENFSAENAPDFADITPVQRQPIGPDGLASGRLGLSPPVRHDQVNILGKILLSFAATRNLSKLLDTKQRDSTIGCLNGIRVISMSWIILGHAVVFGVIYSNTQNYGAGTKWLQNFPFQAVSNAYFAVDSFFFLSGFLVAYLGLARMDKLKSAKAWFWFYFHRYLRLTPMLGLTILVWMYIQPFIGDSPVWFYTVNKPWCAKYWWTNLLYINNFYPKGFESQCIGWTWYLANDMQFFIISPLLLVPLYYAPTLGVLALSAVSLICMLVTAYIMIAFNASMDIVGIALSASNGYGLDDNSLMYEKPYCRIAPYLVGIGLGFIMHRIGKRRVVMSPMSTILGWLMATAVAVCIVYAFYPSYHDSKQLVLVGQVVYGMLSRFGWALALTWVVFACKYGYGGWIDRFLSWSAWIPLSRITYATYMFHPIVYTIFYGNFGTPIYMSRYLLVFFYAGNLLVTYAVALVVTLAVEYPVAHLEKFLMPRNPKEVSKPDADTTQPRL